METKCIKCVDEETWKKFKNLAENNKINMSILLRIMVNEFEKSNKKFWDEILNGDKLLNDKEADEMRKITREFRKERGFRE